jgi:hypothetical protein
MKYDNSRDRAQYGYDAGNIVDGDVIYDESKKEYVVVDDDGLGFSTQELLKSLLGKKVRITCISFEAIEQIEKMMADQAMPKN